MTGTVSDLVARLATDADFLDRKIMHGTAPAIARDIREAAKALTRLEQERDAAVERVRNDGVYFGRWRTEQKKSAAANARAEAAEAELSACREALVEAREVVDAVAGENRPARAWAIVVRDSIDAALSPSIQEAGE